MIGRPRCREWTALVTQQLRLRSLIQIVGYNIGRPEVCSSQYSFYLTLHHTTMSAPFYTSERIFSQHPKWKEIDSDVIQQMSSNNVVVRVWCHIVHATDAKSEKVHDSIIQTWGVYFSGLRYIGANLASNFSSDSFENNTLVFQMHGGYFCSYKSLKVDFKSIEKQTEITSLSSHSSKEKKIKSKSMSPNKFIKPHEDYSKSHSPMVLSSTKSFPVGKMFTNVDVSPSRSCSSREERGSLELKTDTINANPTDNLSHCIYEHGLDDWYPTIHNNSDDEFKNAPLHAILDRGVDLNETISCLDLLDPKYRYFALNFLKSEIRQSYSATKLQKLHLMQYAIKKKQEAMQDIKKVIYQQSSSTNESVKEKDIYDVQSKTKNRSLRDHFSLEDDGIGSTSLRDMIKNDLIDPGGPSVYTGPRLVMKLNDLLSFKAKPSPFQRAAHVQLSKKLEILLFRKIMLKDEKDSKQTYIRRLKDIHSKLLEENQDDGLELMQDYHALSRRREVLKETRQSYDAVRGLGTRSSTALLSRRSELLNQLHQIFYIAHKTPSSWTIIDVPLPISGNENPLVLRTVSDAVAAGFVAQATCLTAVILNLPLRYRLELLGSTQCVQVLSKDKQVLLWVVFSNSISEGKIACNPIYAKLIGLQEGLEVFVSPYGDVKVLDELHVDADSPDDQEILEHNAELLQLRVLDQLRLVVANQKAVVWISTSLPIIFTPKQTGILVNHSQIIVKVDAFNSMQGLKTTPTETVKEIDSKFKNIGILHQGMLSKYLNVPERHVFRTLLIDSDGKRNLNHPYTVFLNDCYLENFKEKTLLATIKNIPSILQDNDANDNENNNSNLLNDLFVEVVPITNVIYRSLCREIHNRNIPTVLIPKTLNALVNIENGTKIILTIVRENIDVPDHIEIVTYSEQVQSEIDVIEKFKGTVIDDTHAGKKFLINDSIVHQNTRISQGFLQLKVKPEKLKYSSLNSDSFRSCTVSAKCLKDTDFAFPKPIVSTLDYDCKNYCRTVKCIEALVDKVLSHLYFEIHRDASFKNASQIKSNVLVTGLSGTGKTALCHTIQKELTVWSHLLHCRSLKGRKDITEVLGKAILLCQEHSPSVLICDDFDALVPPNMEGASPQDIAYYQRLAVVIKQQLQSCSGVVVLMTSQSMKELHPTLRQFSGKPLFTAHFQIPELEQMERVELFEHLLNDTIREQFSVDDDDVIKMAMDTTGHNVRELTDYFHKRVFKAIKKKKNLPSSPNPRLVDDITTDSEQANAFDIWAPVGGLEDVKRSLTESIFWPIMYPALFPSQSSGILLYGPPGTGKSHIGSCLARLTNMSLIAVKGPELLSKYIGQSEKAVRDIFDKADMKRPCILFFDEFDSLAPKRGHDSTGVTDRVVNQLLTGLDGAEGGARGAVVASSSRPDLVDPALLRPGRLSTHLYCSLPDQRGRHEVLRTLSKSVTIDEGVDLHQLSVGTDGYSPADLKSLLVTAQLSRLEKQLEAHTEEKSMESVVVHQEDVESALLETKPSLSKEQRLFYDMIYRRFRGEPLTPEQKLISSRTMEKQRVTLA